MNEEQQKRGHELPKKIKIEADTAKGCERIRKLTDEIFDVLGEALRADAAGQVGGKLSDSWSALSAAEIWLRTKMRPRPGTVDFHGEIDYYLRNEPHLKWVPAENPMLDAVIANPPLPEVEPRTTPLNPETPPLVPGEDDKSHIGRPEAAYMLAKLAQLKDFDADYVTALKMAARALMKRHFDCQRNKAKRRAAAARKEAQA